MTARPNALAPIDPLAAHPSGGYADELVEVRRAGPRRLASASATAAALRLITRTPHFALFRQGDRLVVEQALSPEELDEDLTSLLRNELFDAGWVGGSELFERIFTGVVVSTVERPAEAWELFYRNTLTRIEDRLGGQSPDGRTGRSAVAPPEGSVIAEHVPLYDRVLGLVRGHTTIELGCCFGFQSLLLAGLGYEVAAVDISPGTVALVSRMARRLGLAVETIACDAAQVPRAEGAADTVLAVHLLEHLQPGHCIGVLEEALRLARRRVVVAVPFEQVSEPLFGHVQTLKLADLVAWGRSSGYPFQVEEFHGGWLVIDRR